MIFLIIIDTKYEKKVRRNIDRRRLLGNLNECHISELYVGFRTPLAIGTTHQKYRNYVGSNEKEIILIIYGANVNMVA